MKHRNTKYTGIALVAFILILIAMVALGYDVTVGLCGLVMWALVVYIVWLGLKSIFSSGKSDN